jgi:K+-sensing histidine kinase KdpD
MFDADLLYGMQLSKAPLAVRYFAALVLTGLATIMAVATDSAVSIPNLSLIFVVPVIVIAVTFGWGPSLFSAVLGALAYNFFIVEPRYSLRVEDPANVWAIGLLFVVGTIASVVASASRRRADEALLRERQASVLQSYGERLVSSADLSVIASATADALHALFAVPALVLLEEGEVLKPVGSRSAGELRADEVEAARLSLAKGAVVRAWVYPAQASRFDFWPVTTRGGQKAVLGLRFEEDGRRPASDALISVVGACLALSLDRLDRRGL